MAKPIVAPNPKKALLFKVFGKVGGAYRRHMGELSRTRSSATGAATELGKATAGIESVLREVLGATQLPIVTVEQPIPAGEHWLIAPLVSQRNALYAREPVCTLVAYIAKDGTCPIGAIMMPMEDMCLVAETGLGASAEILGRVRCGNRIELDDTLAMVPWKTVDVVEMGLLKTLDDANIHTRKSGNTMADVLDVACGKADMAIATRVNRLEALLSNLIMAESAGFASDGKGKALGPDSTTMVVANPKLHSKVIALLK
jgi:fructose-1,6-bisphosphatase/inositol monophosphatase family enzyme